MEVMQVMQVMEDTLIIINIFFILVFYLYSLSFGHHLYLSLRVSFFPSSALLLSLS